MFYLSSYEGFGLPIIEAMALGCPVVTTDRTSCGEIAGDAALFVEPENIDAVCKLIEDLEKDDFLIEQMMMKGNIQASKYKWENSAAIFLDQLTKHQ